MKENDVSFLRQQLTTQQLDSSPPEFGSFHTYFHMAATAKSEKSVINNLRKAFHLGSQNSGMMQTYVDLVEDLLGRLSVTKFLDHGIKLEELLPLKPATGDKK